MLFLNFNQFNNKTEKKDANNNCPTNENKSKSKSIIPSPPWLQKQYTDLFALAAEDETSGVGRRGGGRGRKPPPAKKETNSTNSSSSKKNAEPAYNSSDDTSEVSERRVWLVVQEFTKKFYLMINNNNNNVVLEFAQFLGGLVQAKGWQTTEKGTQRLWLTESTVYDISSANAQIIRLPANVY